MSRVMCHVSRVTCHMSHVTCHMSKKKKKLHFNIFFSSFFLRKKIGQSGGASRWRVCYQQGLPHIVFIHLAFFSIRATSGCACLKQCETQVRSGQVGYGNICKLVFSQ